MTQNISCSIYMGENVDCIILYGTAYFFHENNCDHMKKVVQFDGPYYDHTLPDTNCTVNLSKRQSFLLFVRIGIPLCYCSHSHK